MSTSQNDGGGCLGCLVWIFLVLLVIAGIRWVWPLAFPS